MEELHYVKEKNVKELLVKDADAERVALLFKAFSEPLRIKILHCMLAGEICVHDLSNVLEVSQPRISNQLRFLRQEGLVKTRKEKNHIFYDLDDGHIQDILTIGLAHIHH